MLGYLDGPDFITGILRSGIWEGWRLRKRQNGLGSRSRVRWARVAPNRNAKYDPKFAKQKDM